MKQVRMRTTANGPAGTWRAGQVVQLSDDVARVLVTGGFAEYVAEKQSLETAEEAAQEETQKPELETAAVEPEETAVEAPPKPKPARRRRKRNT